MQRRGATAIEFALLLPVFVAILIGIMEFSWLFFQRSSLEVAATNACRRASLVDPGIGDVNWTGVVAVGQAALLDELTRLGAPCESGDECTALVSGYGAVPGRGVQCTISRKFQPLLGIDLTPIFGFHLTEMVYEAARANRLEYQR